MKRFVRRLRVNPSLFLCSGLTVHYSLLSLTFDRLFHAPERSSAEILGWRSPGGQLEPSILILWTEIGKMLVSVLLIASSGELRESVSRRRIRSPYDISRDERLEESEEISLVETEGGEERDEAGSNGHERNEVPASCSLRFNLREPTTSSNEVGGTIIPAIPSSARESGYTPLHQRKNSTTTHLASPLPPSDTPANNNKKGSNLSIDVERAKSIGTPALLLIPPTPAPEPSPPPDQIAEVSLLFPDRPSRNSQRTTSSQSTTLFARLLDTMDPEWWKVLLRSVFASSGTRDTRRGIIIVAGLYTVQNRAQYVAVRELPLPMFQLAYQLKIPATAMCSVILLNKSLSTLDWLSLFTLTFGVGLVQISSVLQEPQHQQLESQSGMKGEQPRGLLAVMVACLCSGFASCYFEKILKFPVYRTRTSTTSVSTASRSPVSSTLPSSRQQARALGTADVTFPSTPSIWLRNLQLSTVGTVTSIPFIVYDLTGKTRTDRLSPFSSSEFENSMLEQVLSGVTKLFALSGFESALVWSVVLLQVTGGLLTAMVILHTDNLVKCFATSLSIVLSLSISIVFFAYNITVEMALGLILVLLATLAFTSKSGFNSIVISPILVLLRIMYRRR